MRGLGQNAQTASQQGHDDLDPGQSHGSSDRRESDNSFFAVCGVGIGHRGSVSLLYTSQCSESVRARTRTTPIIVLDAVAKGKDRARYVNSSVILMKKNSGFLRYYGLILSYWPSFVI